MLISLKIFEIIDTIRIWNEYNNSCNWNRNNVYFILQNYKHVFKRYAIQIWNQHLFFKNNIKIHSI